MTTKEDITCAILFADVADSTRLYDVLGDQKAQESIRQCVKCMSKVTEGQNGMVVKTIGDEVLCRFPTAEDAVRAACRIQDAVRDEMTIVTVPLSVRVGVHYGDAIWEDRDIFGDAVNVAARVASVAKPGEIITTEETVAQLSPNLAKSARKFDTVTVRGRRQPITIYDIDYGAEDDDTDVWEPSTTDFDVKLVHLTLDYNGEVAEIPAFAPRFVVGRDPHCDMVITTEPASREHFVIRHRRDKFVLTDTSRNGTFVRTEHGDDMFLRREELTLGGAGIISLGIPVKLNQTDQVKYSCEQETWGEAMKAVKAEQD
ncbi:MAG: adenylate/guanylate cyclase domain-containing protein [Gammaproteobacteria bacterium]